MSNTIRVTPPAPTHARPAVRAAALRDFLTAAPGIVAFGIILGVTVVATQTSALAGLVGGAAVYGGSAQLTATTVLHLGSGTLAAVAAGVVVNVRVVLYGAAMAPWFASQPRWFRLLGPHFIIDQTYLAAVQRPELRGATFRHYWGWLGGSVLVCWLSVMGLGILAAPRLPDLPHLVLVGTAIFAAMLAPRVVDRASLAAVVVGGSTAWLVSRLAPELAILAGAVAGATAATALSRRRSGGSS